MAVLPVESSYDEIPYPSYAFSQSHPNRLAAVARLVGQTPPPLDNCRVLELGCAYGDNLIPMAMSMPNCQFVGIDLSARQIAEANRAARELGVDNLKMLQADILGFADKAGSFDFIIAHGVYSWVPSHVQEAILKLYKQLLSPHGVGFISYNAYPGWHLRGLVRDAMLYHIRNLDDAREQIKQANVMLEFVCKSIPDELVTYGNIFRKEQKGLQEAQGGDSYLFHEFLEESNEPLYFHQFAERLDQVDLQYVAEADLSESNPNRLSGEAVNTLNQLGEDLLAREQYLDFLRNRTFRESLVGHKGLPVDRDLSMDRLQGLFVGSRLKPADEGIDIRSSEVQAFQGPGNTTMRTGHPISKAAFVHLHEIWPRNIRFDELLVKTREMLAGQTVVIQPAAEYEQDNQQLARNLIQAHLAGAIEFDALPAQFVTKPGEKPVANPWARWLVANRDQNYVINLRHEGIKLNEISRYLISLCDGTRDRPQILDELIERVVRDKLVVQKEGRHISEPDEIRSVLTDGLEKNINDLASAALYAQ